MAGARQRLHRARARRAPVRADPGAGRGDLRAPLRHRLRRHPAALAARRPDAHVADLRIFNPDGSEAELSGNGAREAVLYLRARRLDRRGHVHDPDRGRRGHADDHRPGHGSGGDGPRLDCLDGLPRRARRRARDDRRRRARVEFQHVSIGNPQCAIEVGEGLEDLDLPAIGPAIESAPIFPNRTNVCFWQADGSRGAGADLRARGGGDALLGHRAPAAPRSPPTCAARRARSRSCSTAAS